MKRSLLILILFPFLFISACHETENPVSESPASELKTKAGEVLSSMPEILRPSAHYLIYLHGAIVENQGMHPVSEKFGAYEYPGILQAFADRGFIVISEARQRATRPNVFARHLVLQLNHLLDGGIPEDHITVVGFSKGGVIAALASGELLRDHVNWVLQASCGPWVEKLPDLTLHGRVLSLYDQADDMAGSCEALFSRMGAEGVHKEIILDLDSGHGAFYTPDPAWLEACIEFGGL